MEIPDWLLAIIGTLFGGAGLKIIESYLTKGDRAFNDASSIRKELRTEMEYLRSEVLRLKLEVDEWKEEYFNVYFEYRDLAQTYNYVIVEIKEVEELLDKMGIDKSHLSVFLREKIPIRRMKKNSTKENE